MPKSLLLVLSVLLLAAPTARATDARSPRDAVQFGRSASSEAREAWFRQAVDDFLEGRDPASARQAPDDSAR